MALSYPKITHVCPANFHLYLYGSFIGNTVKTLKHAQYSAISRHSPEYQEVCLNHLSVFAVKS